MTIQTKADMQQRPDQRHVRGTLEKRRANPKISIAMTPEMLKRIAVAANKRGVSFASEVRRLIVLALT